MKAVPRRGSHLYGPFAWPMAKVSPSLWPTQYRMGLTGASGAVMKTCVCWSEQSSVAGFQGAPTSCSMWPF